jgi:hypothetical protein
MNFGDAMAGDQQNARRGQLDRVAQSRIGQRLRLVYRHLVGEPIPDDQIHLLLALRWKEREQGGSAFKASGAPEAGGLAVKGADAMSAGARGLDQPPRDARARKAPPRGLSFER